MWLKSVILPVGTNADSLSGMYVKHRGSANESQEFLPALDVAHQSGLWKASLYITAVPVHCLLQQHRTTWHEPSSTGLVPYTGFGKNSVT